MLELMFVLFFFIAAILYIVIESVKAKDITVQSSIILYISRFSTIIKAIPAGLATILVLFMKPNDSFFYITLALGLFLCMIGDIGMEKGLVIGLTFFLLAQIFFCISFIYQSIEFNITFESLLIPFLVAISMFIYITILLRYLESSEVGLGKFKVPGITYFLFISLMLVSAVLLWVTSKEFKFGVVVLGGLLFVLSDSTIAVNQFHHNISYREIKVMSTYYTAILLISFAVFII